jgi:glycosyltransferase involved in cell wall biosynthesis
MVDTPYEYEIIVVNDGTKDASIDVIKEIISANTNIKLINQENSGLSEARNVGLSNATGRYVWFIDSDDCVETSKLGELFDVLHKNDIDLIQIQHTLTYEDGRQAEPVSKKSWDGIISGYELIKKGGLPSPAQFTIYRREFLLANNLRFVKGIYHEDSEFKPRAVYYAKRCMSFDSYVYYYLQRTKDSITSSFKKKNGIDLIFIMNSLLSFVKSENPDLLSKQYFFRCIGLYMNSLLYGLTSIDGASRNELIIKLKKNKPLFVAMCKSKKKKYQLEGLMLLINVRLATKVYSLIK